MPIDNTIRKIGIYYSRFNYFYILEIKDVVDENNFPEFIEWFKVNARNYV